MTTNQIRDLIGQNRLREAIENTRELTGDNIELNNLSNAVSNAFQQYNDNIIMGVLDFHQKDISRAKIVQQLNLLLDKIDLNYLHQLSSSLEELQELVMVKNDSAGAETAHEIERIHEENKPNKFVDNKQNIKKSPLERLGNFLVRVGEPESSENKIISNISNGFKTVKKIAKLYNHVADWIPVLPNIPQVLLL